MPCAINEDRLSARQAVVRFQNMGQEKILKAFSRKKTGQLQTNKNQKWSRASPRARFDQWRRENSGTHFLNRLKLRCLFRCCIVQFFLFFLSFFFLVGSIPITLVTTYYISCLYAILVSMPRYTHIYKMYIHVYIHVYMYTHMHKSPYVDTHIHRHIHMCAHVAAQDCAFRPMTVMFALRPGSPVAELSRQGH